MERDGRRLKTRGMSSSDAAAAGKSVLWNRMDCYTDALDMLSQWEKFDGLKRLDFKTIGKWKFIQFCGDGFRANCIHIAPEREVHVGMRRVRAFGARAKELDQPDLRVPPEDTRDQGQFIRSKPYCFHGSLCAMKNSCKDAIAGR